VRADWTAKLRKFVEDAELGTPNLEVEVRIGHPFTELMDACRVEGAGLLVMGVKGSRQDPHRVGAIATKCVRKSPVDVLLVREDARGPFQQVAACVDFSPDSERAARRAVQICALEGAPLDCVHVYQSALAMSVDYGGMVSPLSLGADDVTLEHWQRELAAFAERVVKDHPTVAVETHVLERINIREAVLEHVCAKQADLVVLGTRGKTGLRELLMGTTAEKIVANAPCSILVVKPEAPLEAEE
jgi:nucleotide-binding universal stress UspA family protein